MPIPPPPEQSEAQTPPPPPPPPPPTQQQADEAQQARYAAELAILALILSRRRTSNGEGSSEEKDSSIDIVKILFILALLSRAVKRSSFRGMDAISDDEVAKRLSSEAESAYKRLAASELSDDQAATLWATWAYSRTADEIARIITTDNIEHEFRGTGRVLKKVWISRTDRRVRALHAKLHGKVVNFDADFWRWPHTNQRLRWPGDIEAPLDATAGCRCVSLLTWADQGQVSNTIRRIVEETDPSS